MKIGRRGFTLIEILIVVAIIAILASVVLVGLAPTQQAGRDARRLSDLREVQNGLELFYQNCGFYPGGSPSGSGVCASYQPPTDWASLGAALTAVVPNVGTIPTDPSSNRSYSYWFAQSDASSYVLGAALENANNSVFTTYTAPDMSTITYSGPLNGGGTYPQNCTKPNYCVSL